VGRHDLRLPPAGRRRRDLYDAPRLIGWRCAGRSIPGRHSAGGYGAFLQNGRQAAGIGPATDPKRGTSWTTYLATDDVTATAGKAEASGGKVVMAPMQVMDQGSMAIFQDPTGAFIAMWQPGRHRGAEVTNEHGSLTWAELMTSDVAAAKAFYESIFGVTTRDVALGRDEFYTLVEADGRPVAGAMQIRPEWGPMPSAWSVYFAVDDCDAIAAKTTELGGAVSVPPTDIPIGRFAVLGDPQGGHFGVIRLSR
jgi:predicted enzyme related to lactoylglutathione lyase